MIFGFRLRNRLPNEEVKLKLENESNDKSNNRGDAAYRELAKHCKEEDDIELDDQHEMMDAEDSTETHQEIEVVNVPESYDGQYENINESYFQNTGESITLKVIDNQLSEYFIIANFKTKTKKKKISFFILTDYSLPTPTAASLVAIPQTSHLNATIVAAPSSADSKKRQFDGASSTGPFIAYTPLRQDRVISDNQIARTHYLLATTTSSESTSVASAPPAQAPPAQATRKETVVVSTEQSATIQNLQRREHELRLKEAKIRVEIQEIEREKAREELIQMREIHKLKIKEMELKLRNMERS